MTSAQQKASAHLPLSGLPAGLQLRTRIQQLLTPLFEELLQKQTHLNIATVNHWDGRARLGQRV